MIVGTAGHIDHGKTALVRALTGVDTDRLKEEKARGISIELGYAYLPPEEGEATADTVIGFVDVPGHERFIHTMVAGATGIDIALLVVAADDGPMPQTREHLAILQLLGIQSGVVALTKVDRVAPERVEAVRAQLQALFAGSAFADAPAFACNSMAADDPGIQALRQHLRRMAAKREPMRDRRSLLRMPVDRVFALPGHGTTVTGSVVAGQVPVGADVILMPAGKALRIRSVHAHNRPASEASAGQRCALNLAGIATEGISRGDWIADARAFAPTPRADARLHLLTGAPVLRDGLALQVHWGSAHGTAHVLLLDAVDDGRGALVQLVFDAPVCMATGDRFIVRHAGSTVGGGVALDPEAPYRRRRGPARLAWLQALEQWLRDADLEPLLSQAPLGLPMTTLVRRCQRAAQAIPVPPRTRVMDAHDGGHAIAETHWQALGERVIDAVRDWHRRRPDDPGVESRRLQRARFHGVADALWDALLQSLHGQGRLRRNGAWWLLPEHDRQLSEREHAALQTLLPALLGGGFDPPWVRTLAADQHKDEDVVRGVLRRAAARGAVYQVVPDLFYHPQRIAELAAIVDKLSQDGGGGVDAATFRDAIGLGRKRSIQILEFFDRIGYTRRVGDAHRPRGDICWPWDATRDAP